MHQPSISPWVLPFFTLSLLPGCSLPKAPEQVLTALASVDKAKRPDPLDPQVRRQLLADDNASQAAHAVERRRGACHSQTRAAR